MSRFGNWTTDGGLPAFSYTADQTADPEAEWDTRMVGRSRRHSVGVGNRRIQMFVDNYGTAALFDEHTGLRWLNAPEPIGSGVSLIRSEDATWGTEFELHPSGGRVVRTFGPTWFSVECASPTLAIKRTILCPEGEQPWVLVRVNLTALEDVEFDHVEQWTVRPRFINLAVAPAMTAEQQERAKRYARLFVAFTIDAAANRVRAIETRHGDPSVPLEGGGGGTADVVFGSPLTLHLEGLAGGTARPQVEAREVSEPTLMLVSEHRLKRGETCEIWFRFGVEDGSHIADPLKAFEESLSELEKRLPRGESAKAPMAEREIPWHAAILTGQACRDAVLGNHTLDQGCAYSFLRGFNGAARDPLQHALPLIYFEPDLALSVLRNTVSWGAPDGGLPWAIDGAKQVRVQQITPGKSFDRPSDLSLWSLWLASEYAAATGDVGAFQEPVAFHPSHGSPPARLIDHLKGHFAYLLERVGLGPNGHLRVLDCDWADGHMGNPEKYGLTRDAVRAQGESILNSAMAAWILPIWAGLCRRLGEGDTAADADGLGARLRDAVAAEWNGRWFRRGRYGDIAFGDSTMFLEVQPWAILCGAATAEQSRSLLATINDTLRANSPLGARQQWPVPAREESSGPPGEALSGGIWPALQMPLIWAAARHDPELAWDEWRRFSLAGHEQAYPDVWEGTLSGPDSYNAPESETPGRSFAMAHFSMQQFPTNCLHVHAQPLIAYLRLLGVEPLPDGALQAHGGPGWFRSRTFEICEDGSGSLDASGDVTVETRHRRIQASSGRVQWS